MAIAVAVRSRISFKSFMTDSPRDWCGPDALYVHNREYFRGGGTPAHILRKRNNEGTLKKMKVLQRFLRNLIF